MVLILYNLPLNCQSQQLSSALSSACDLKSHFCKQCGPRSDCSSSPHCLPVCKNRFEKFARIFSRRHKQTIFSDAGFLGIFRVSNLLMCLKTAGSVANTVDTHQMHHSAASISVNAVCSSLYV